MTATFGDPRLPANFWSKVRVNELGCWEWTAAKNSRGYGCFAINAKSQLAHRVSYIALVGPIAEGLQIDHLCRNKTCVRPTHLEPVSATVNVRRAIHAANPDVPVESIGRRRLERHWREFWLRFLDAGIVFPIPEDVEEWFWQAYEIERREYRWRKCLEDMEREAYRQMDESAEDEARAS